VDHSAGGSSTCPSRPSLGSPRSPKASVASDSPGELPGGLGRSDLKELAARHGLRPTKRLGQHFLADPNLARAIVADAAIRPGDRVLEVGAGFGSLTVALARAGAWVLAIETDRGIATALEHVVAPFTDVRVVLADAMDADWDRLLEPGRWAMVSNLPYNISVPLLLDLLERVDAIDRFLVMVQLEVGDRLVSAPGDAAYGAVSIRVAYHADARLVRRVPADVFWPRPRIDSVLIGLTRHEPPVEVDRAALFRVVDEGFAERRKTMSNALKRLGLDAHAATDAMHMSGLEPSTRAERLGLPEFARIARHLLDVGWRP
jgi:16S rRNA (adenine1518-N6/adenine1519-N6)-dimethyltransferase